MNLRVFGKVVAACVAVGLLWDENYYSLPPTILQACEKGVSAVLLMLFAFSIPFLVDRRTCTRYEWVTWFGFLILVTFGSNFGMFLICVSLPLRSMRMIGAGILWLLSLIITYGSIMKWELPRIKYRTNDSQKMLNMISKLYTGVQYGLIEADENTFICFCYNAALKTAIFYLLASVAFERRSNA